MEAAFGADGYGAAFIAAHTLKGIGLNLCFPQRAKASADLTAAVRPAFGTLERVCTDADGIRNGTC